MEESSTCKKASEMPNRTAYRPARVPIAVKTVQHPILMRRETMLQQGYPMMMHPL